MTTDLKELAAITALNNMHLKELAAITALNNMLAKGWMDICTIRSVAEMLGRDPRGDALEILRSLHCINFNQMPKELRDEIPRLIEQCLNCAPTHRFTEAPRCGLMRLLWGGR